MFFILFWFGVLYRVEFAKVFFVIVAKSRSRSVDWLVFLKKARVVWQQVEGVSVFEKKSY